MNDLPWIKYFAQAMFLDTVGMSAAGERAHRRLCDYTWYNDGPPKNDTNRLRRITQTASVEWGNVRQELLDKGWTEGEFFLHRRVIKSLNESKTERVANHNRTRGANDLAAWSLSPPDPVTGVRRILTVTQNVTSDVTTHVTSPQLQVQLEDTPPPTRAGEIPTIEQAVVMTMTAAIPEDFCRYVYGDWSSRGGRDGGNVVVDWLPYVTKRWAREQVEWKAGTHKGNRKTNGKDRRTDTPSRNAEHNKPTGKYAAHAAKQTC